MMTLIEIFSALIGLLVLGTVHSAWQTNPILSHPLGRLAIVLVIISGILGWNYYETLEKRVEEAEAKIAEDKKIEHEKWTFTTRINTQESYCLFFKEYPHGRFSEFAESLCHPHKPKLQAALVKQQAEAAVRDAVAKQAAQIAQQNLIAKQKSEELRLLEEQTAKLKAEKHAILVQKQAALNKKLADEQAETERQNALNKKQQAENLRADAQAMFLQGSNYAKGKGGVAQDFKLACEWFKKAAAAGSKDGKKYAHSKRCKRLL